MKITLKTSPDKILNQFKEVLEKGGSINLDQGNGDFIYLVGGEGAILSKLQRGVHYVAKENAWVRI